MNSKDHSCHSVACNTANGIAKPKSTHFAPKRLQGSTKGIHKNAPAAGGTGQPTLAGFKFLAMPHATDQTDGTVPARSASVPGMSSLHSSACSSTESARITQEVL
eukprot:3372346-Rhodomonas_salina.1